MKKILLALMMFSSFSFADYLYNPASICVKSFYFSNIGTLYYVRSDTGATVSTTTTNLGDDLISGYEYNSTSERCEKSPFNNALKIENDDFNFMMALSGLACGLFLTSIVFFGLKV
ncbi:MAG: hypothetical protein PHN38_01055 [Sulfurospirillaceae bacterium]|nr:hypothetical protein [Sulfurospirillaceae bacterium]